MRGAGVSLTNPLLHSIRYAWLHCGPGQPHDAQRRSGARGQHQYHALDWPSRLGFGDGFCSRDGELSVMPDALVATLSANPHVRHLVQTFLEAKASEVVRSPPAGFLPSSRPLRG